MTYGQKTDQEFITAVANNAKANGETITLAGHSGGGLRNYLTLQNAEQNQFLDANGNSVLAVQFSGTPANYQSLLNASNNAGVGEIKFQNNSGDTVGNVLGMNGNIVEGVWSGINVISLFEPKMKPDVQKIINNPAELITDFSSNFNKLESPHSSYGCILSSCNSKAPDLLTNSSLNSN